MGEIGRLLKDRFEARRVPLSARVTSIPLDADGKQRGYVLAEVAGVAGVAVHVGPSDNYYPGDWLSVEQRGGGASANYVAVGYTPGARPQAGVWQLPSDTALGYTNFGAGDVVLGNPFQAYWWYDYSEGRWYVRDGVNTYGALGFLDGVYGYSGSEVGFVFGNQADTWIAGDDVNGFRIFAGAIQRVALNPDGSGWFVDPAVFGWDTSGNLTLSGRFEALALRIGARAAGPAIRGGEVIELDSLGAIIVETTARYGLRIYNEAGLPKIALLTGTLDNPDVPAALFGAEGDPNYLWYKDGTLRLKGQAVIDGGQLGGFIVTDKRITSTNNKVILVNANDAAYAEGLLLVTGDAANAGTLAWRKSTAAGHEDDYSGIVTTVQQDTATGPTFGAGTTMLLGASNRFHTVNPRTVLRMEASTPMTGGEKAYLELGKIGNAWGFGEDMWLRTNAMVQAKGGIRAPAISPELDGGILTLYGLTGRSWIGPGEFVYVTQLGTAGRLTTTGSGIQCVPAAYDMWFKLDVPANLANSRVETLQQLTLYYKTTISGAYIASVQIVKQNMTSDDVTVVAGYGTRLGDGTTGYGSQPLLEENVGLEPARPHLIRVTLGGVTDYGHVTIYGFLAEWKAW